ncbi:hypothetical protein JZ751_009610 [Albula glossodonta]|uniref:CHHC U11-48K-type domain-containing protein n=1 Tax=Albula glossodonta TaxID=121402 RepID=A0A8T2NY82_9TELE|nr:hypothetical protein JZ751_009610 [Albula glossodonta]
MCDSPFDNEVADALNSRLQSLHELTEFTESCQKQLDGLFEALGWSNESTADSIQEEPMEVCPFDSNHRVPQRSMARHKVSCRLNKMGYSKEEQADMYDPTICYEKANIPAVVIGDYSAEPPDVPQNHKRAICDLTVADRLALYDHVIEEASKQRMQAKPVEGDDLYVDLVAKLKKGEEQNGPKSHLEVLAEMRDYKRRRQSYRAKNVHITKKSYTEVIREVIDVHSGELARLWEEEKEEEEAETSRASRHSSHRRRSEERRSASVESRQSLSSSRDEHGSRRRRHRSRERNKDRDRNRERDRERDRDRDRDKDRDDRRHRVSRSPEERRHDRKRKRKGS